MRSGQLIYNNKTKKKQTMFFMEQFLFLQKKLFFFLIVGDAQAPKEKTRIPTRIKEKKQQLTIRFSFCSPLLEK